MGYYLPNIFEHLRKQALKQENDILVIQDFNDFGWNCPKLFRSDTPDKIITMVPGVGKMKLEKIKTVLSDQGEITAKMSEHEKDIQNMKRLIEQFQHDMKKI